MNKSHTNNSNTTTTTRARTNNRSNNTRRGGRGAPTKQPEVHVPVPLSSRRGVIGRLIKALPQIRQNSEVSSVAVFLRFEEDQVGSDEHRATGYVKVASRDLAAVNLAASEVQTTLDALIEEDTRPRDVPLPRGPASKTSAGSMTSMTPLEAALALALEKEASKPKQAKRAPKPQAKPSEPVKVEQPAKAPVDGWTTVGTPKKVTPSQPKKAPPAPKKPKQPKQSKVEPAAEEFPTLGGRSTSVTKTCWGAEDLSTVRSSEPVAVEAPKQEWKPPMMVTLQRPKFQPRRLFEASRLEALDDIAHMPSYDAALDFEESDAPDAWDEPGDDGDPHGEFRWKDDVDYTTCTHAKTKPTKKRK